MNSKSRLVIPLKLIAVWLMVASAWQVLGVDPIVSNVKAKQREGSRLVDITYDVADPDSPTLTVYLKVSADGGKTWKGPVELVSGDVGQHIVPGTAKKLVWDAGKEMPNQFGVKYRYRIRVSDELLAPAGTVLIPATPFQMGDARVFAMEKWEVSIELWESVRAWGNAHGYDLVAGGSFGATHPVHTVTWYTVVKWNNARSEKEGKVPAYYLDEAMTQVYRTGNQDPVGVKWDAGYRLPTAAEWEKAARGGVAGKLYPWGTDQISPELANFWSENSGSNKGKTTPVGSYRANGYGLYDMAGNVWEWCWDLHLGSYRVHRGGSWGAGPEFCRVAYLSYDDPSNSYSYPGLRGFRSVLPPEQP
jgi:sulfatase modifying factor 1